MPINVGQAVGYIDLDTSNFSKGLKSAWKDLKTFADESKSLTKRTGALGKGLNGIGTTLTKNLTVPIAAAGAASLKAGIEFESAFAGIRKTVDATETEFEQLREGILDMSREMPQSASELAAVGEIAGQLGIETENILDFTKAMVMLGDTTNLSSTEAATSLSRLANITGMSQDNFDRLGSSIVKLGNNFATTEAEIASMALNISSAGTQIGLSESEILGFAAALSSVGIQAELGGTALSKVMIQMQLAVETGGTALQNFATVANMSIDDFKNAFQKDAASAIQAFIVGLKDTERLGDSTIKILNDMGIKEVRLRDTLLRAANASDVLNDAIEKSNKAWDENSALVDEANKRYETTESQLKILWNNVVELGIRIADVLLPAFNKIVKSLQNFVKWLGQLDEDLVTAMVTIAGIVAVLGPVISIIGKLIITVTKVTGIIKNCTVVMTALKAIVSALSGPIGIAVVAIAALTAGIVALSKGTINQTERQRELNKQIKESEEAYKSAKEATDKQSESFQSNVILASDLINEMYELSEQEMDTAKKVNILTGMNEKLKEIIPDLNIEIDEQTGKIKTQKSEVLKLANAWVQASVAEIYSQKNKDEADRFVKAIQAQNAALEEQSKLDYQIYEKQKQIEDLKKESGKYKTIEELSTEDAKKALNATGKAMGDLIGLQEQYEAYGKIASEQQQIMEDSKNAMGSLATEQDELTNQILQALGVQIDGNEGLIESNEDVIESNKEKSQYNNLITQEELDGIEDVQKEKEKAFEAEKDRYNKLKDVTQDYFDDAVRLEEQYNEDLKGIYDEQEKQLVEVTEAYNKALEDRKSAIRGAHGLFDEFVKADEDSLSGNQLLKNLKSQLKGIQEWRENLDELAERGIAKGLLEELQELGPTAAVEIENLTKLSDKKLQEYVSTWEDLNQEIAQQASEELAPQREELEAKIDEINLETAAKIAELNTSMEQELDNLTNKYVESIKELGVNVVPEANETGIEIVKAIEIGVEETEESLMNKLEELKDRVKAIVRQIKRDVASAEDAADSIDGSHKNGLDYVPYDGYIAQLHKGERVLTKEENQKYNEANIKTSGSQTLNVNFGGSLGQLIRLLKPEFELDDDRGGVQY